MKRATLSSLTSLRILIPILVILFVVSMFLRVYRMTAESAGESRQTNLKGSLTTGLIIALLAVYLLVYAYLTFFFRRPTKEPQINLTPFWSYREAFQWSPFKIRRLGLAREILLNILLTVPLGLLLPLLFYRAKHPVILTIAVCAGLSVMTETLQYFLHLGLCETDDLIDNLLGCCLGMGILFIGTCVLKRRMRQR